MTVRLDSQAFVNAVDSNHIMVIHIVANRITIIDLATNREIILINEMPKTAHFLSQNKAERIFNNALQGAPGYSFENFTSDEYTKFCEAFMRLSLS